MLPSSSTLWMDLGVDVLDFMPTCLYFSWAALDMGLIGRSQVPNPAFLILPEVCYLFGFKTHQKDLGVPVEITGELQFKQ